ncbi:hypothetical protein AKJ51_00920 [candidate division MSBL1 archaeon SCGC-AAA382A20]|uniref:4Fe-4S ferredoxin-type domain-containing protein n=1 Tax=candidate division MSBL1 archaeon SCGC-AAA382A20 TaxID=1698280 RepID=A0A133VMG3_9EURY|nr:hypothetical protein AKJ51_00920 [candidate division MSBL1 archaeon SCGC-AAA382A20]
MVKVIIDQDECMRCGFCTSICTKVFELDEKGETAQITPNYQHKNSSTGEIPKKFDCVEIVERKCPRDAVKIKD